MISMNEVSPGDVINYGMHCKFWEQPLQLISLAVACVKLPLFGVCVLWTGDDNFFFSLLIKKKKTLNRDNSRENKDKA